MTPRAALLALSCSTLALGCAATEPPGPGEDTGAYGDSITAAKRKERAQHIKDVAASRGLRNGLLLAGIANAETQMAQCWSELTWACKGPYSADCGGPVVAGAGDGPCSAKQGGLGMFQFDAGTFTDTLEREGNKILSVDGNIDAAIDFVLDMVIDSSHVSGVSTEAEALAWLNAVEVDGPTWDDWITTVTHYYNGCSPSGCSVFSQRYDHYDESARALVSEFGAAFWSPSEPMELAWARGADGAYTVWTAGAPPEVTHVSYRVDDYLIGDGDGTDATPAVDDDYSILYTFNYQKSQRLFEATGYDAAGAPIARAIGLIDSIPGTAVFIRQTGAQSYEIGLERAPAEVASIEVRADGYLLTDGVSGKTRSTRKAVASGFTKLGQRQFKITTFDAAGKVRGNLYRTFSVE